MNGFDWLVFQGRWKLFPPAPYLGDYKVPGWTDTFYRLTAPPKSYNLRFSELLMSRNCKAPEV
jgi:hypothetical protein